jgi:hypothetical protein
LTKKARIKRANTRADAAITKKISISNSPEHCLQEPIKSGFYSLISLNYSICKTNLRNKSKNWIDRRQATRLSRQPSKRCRT